MLPEAALFMQTRSKTDICGGSLVSDNNNSAFLNSILFYGSLDGHAQNNWSLGLEQSLKAQNFDEVPFLTPQLLEPSVLFEVARQAELSEDRVENFDYDLRGPVTTLKWLLDMIEWATPVQRLNLATCLSASCRYSAAKRVLDCVDLRALYPDQKLSYWLADFVISNRLSFGESHDRQFQELKFVLENNTVPGSRALDIAAQAIVWGLKNQSLDPSLYKWFLENGFKVAAQLGYGCDFREKVSLSAFHRAYAMIPAAEKDRQMTRKHMLLAEEFAFTAEPKTAMNECTLLDARKTVLESTLKEMLYVQDDIDAAMNAGERLIALDSNWSISYHELAEVHLKAGEVERSLSLYEQSLKVGLPRLAFSQYMVGACLSELGRQEEAISAFHETIRIDPTNISAGISGYKASQMLSAKDSAVFKQHLDSWEKIGLLTEEHKELM